MPMKHSPEQHCEYLDLIHHLSVRWTDALRDHAALCSGAYWDLLTRLWRADAPVRKTDALRFMAGVRSAHTGGKYIEAAIREGMIVETDNPEDGRSKLLALSPAMRRRLDGFFDAAVDEVSRSAKRIEEKGRRFGGSRTAAATENAGRDVKIGNVS